jgi:hypothetical protein
MKVIFNILAISLLTNLAIAGPDCDGNGIDDAVDINAGRLVDANGNGVPDCCERGYPCAINLVQNGSFEFGPQQPDCTWVLVAPGATNVSPWQVTSGTVDRVRISSACPAVESWRSFDGEFTVDLVGQQAGRLAQSVATIPGYRYLLTFATSTNNSGQTSGQRTIRVQAGSLDTTISQQVTPYPARWIIHSHEVVASASVTTITFTDLSTIWTAGMVLDDVRFVPAGTFDCNTDGRYDYEQIVSGELVDANGNGIPDGASITAQPTDQNVGVDTPVTFIVETSTTAGCTTPVTYQWQRRNPLVADPAAPGAWIDLADGNGFLNTRGSGLIIARPTPGLATGYRCKIGGGCGCEPAQGGFIYTDTVNFTIACPADFNADGGIDFGDIEAFFERWENGC